MEDEFKTVEKPNDWPANARENMLDIICDKVEEFRDKPSYKSREVLLSLLCEHDLNQHTGYGLVRVTEYEVAMINYLYLVGATYQINSLKTYLYNIITETTRLTKMASWCNPVFGIKEQDSARIMPYEQGLEFSLRLYHIAYQKYTIEKNASFAEQLVEVVTSVLNINPTEEEICSIAYAYSAMLNDISNMHGSKKERLWEFTREELRTLFELEAKLLKMNNQSPTVRPTKGILMMQISNFILRSRHNYNEDYICKYLPKEVAKASVSNHQIWMKKTELLNDEREQKIIPELFKDTSWIKYDWIKDVDFTATRTYYVSSFSKAVNSSEMQEGYGDCIYGYKNDRIVDLIGPIGIARLKKKDGAESSLPDTIERPYISQVVTFDVLYDIEEAKEELAYLFEIVNMFEMDDLNKRQFLQELLQYWILSVKDYKWHEEKERRYVLFLYDDYNYKETELNDTFLKIKTSLFLTPDFIIGENPGRREIMRQLTAKRKALFSKEYLFCKDCLMQDYDLAIMKMPRECPVCGSENIEMVYYKE